MSYQPPVARFCLGRLIVCLFLLTWGWETTLAADVEAAGSTIRALPGEVTLDGPRARHRIVIERVEAGDLLGQVTEGVVLTLDPEGVVSVKKSGDGGHVATPIADGIATVTARVGEAQTTMTIRVVGSQSAFAWSFRNHVQPVLTKMKCNSGACHGAAAGKNGFKLSLRGYDAEGDHLALTRHSRGRRIVPEDPGRSLVLTKPLGLLPHKGGIRFEKGSLEYDVLSGWIAGGAPPPRSDDPRILRLEILPEDMVLRVGAEQQLIVRAHFSDGRAEDVTQWVKFTGTNSAVARVDDNGKIRVVGYGEGAVTVWYLSRIVTATVSVPYDNRVAPEVFDRVPTRSFIDHLVLEKLRRLNLPPSPPASDVEFLRRAFVDTIGVLPTPDEVRGFVFDPDPAKRDRVIDDLLERPEYVDYWSYKWSDLLLVNSKELKGSSATWAYYSWIRDRVEANASWKDFARGIVTATGDTLENGAANFFLLHRDPLDMAETTSVTFLGMSINCARCHDHPLEKWTNEQYYSMANLFARVRRKETRGARKMIFAAADGEVIQPLSGQPQLPTPLDGTPIEFDDRRDRREHLADWLTRPENPYFSRAIANRVWANYLGVGLVEAVDDLRMTNPASNEKLLSALGRYLAENDYDLKKLMRLILRSATYQRSSRAVEGNGGDRRFYSHYYSRRMMAEVMLDVIAQVTDVPTPFPGYPAGWRALQLPDSTVSSYFLRSFGRPDRVITCECERTDQPSMAQILHIANGDTINAKLRAAGSRVTRLIEAKKTNKDILEDVYLRALCRLPTAKERTEIMAILDGTPDADRREVIEDLFWSVLSSKEFLFNH